MFGVSDPAVVAAVRAYVKLMRASRAVLARIEPLLARSGLTVTQLGVLEAVLHKGPQTQRALGRLVLTSAGNMTDVIDKLESRGLVVRVAVPGDRRSLHVALTEPGRALIEDVFPRHAADIAAAMAGVAPEEFDGFGDLLRAVGRGKEGVLF
ncbi:MAG: MarR family transcriptional regulator [Alphaproteobacteria bacterium]|nr:MarR family transcriptional regulator [Alphaproteobacteria bacterium]